MSATSHPFINFNIETDRIGAGTWIAIGEAMSKCQHLAGVPLKPAAAQTMMSVSLARGVQATTAIEGNTLSDSEVQAIVDKGTANVSESRTYLETEVRNILAAISEIDAALHEGARLPIDVARLCRLNEQVLRDTPQGPEVVPGRFREHDVAAGRYKAPHWTEVPDLTQQLVKWLDELRDTVTTDSRREDRFVNAVLSAILAHLYIAWVHPFGNGNGRLARLVEVQILSESGVIPLVATNFLSDHYNKTRDAYYVALDAAQRDVLHFVGYSVQGFLDELRDAVKVLRAESLTIHWESYVYEKFRDQPSTPARTRQRHLALAMPHDEAVSPEAATELTTRLAKLYGKCGERVPARDLNDLVKLELVTKTGSRKYRSNRGVVEAFIPPVSAP
ncbi:Fic family protein [Nocardioides sp. 503]|uniref:Fic family protein n=1 Tax=Nocardioides sp. 503 TaxID=2508326 RepID=UPI00106FDD46|nr:Fic family protein [Nocardioides sp. 503]